jgi:predicted phage terminase large subunit-like protein
MRFDNNRAGFRMASSCGGVGTGEGGDFIVADDPHNVVEAESDAERAKVIHWWGQSMSTRGNDPRTVRHVVVMQRLHETDLTGHLLEQGGYEHLCLPMEFEPDRRCVTSLGCKDPRRREGELLCPARFPRPAVEELTRRLGFYGAAGQLQQRPAPQGGGLFKRDWFQVVPLPSTGWAQRVRYWDLASALEGDFTVGVLMSRDEEGKFYVEDVRRGQWDPSRRDEIILRTAKDDGHAVQVILEQEPGSAGVSVTTYLARKLAGFSVSKDRPTGDKVVRAQPLASQCGVFNVALVSGGWNEAFIDELSVFPNGRYDDQVDAASGALSWLTRNPRSNQVPERLATPRQDVAARFGIPWAQVGESDYRYQHRVENQGRSIRS